MSEGNVYPCVWAKRGDQHTIALKRDRSVKVSAPELEEAREKMWDLLCEKFGDGEAILEYVTPPPEAATEFTAHYGSPHLVTVAGNDSLGSPINKKEVYPKGYCRHCGRPLVTAAGVVPEHDYVTSSDGAVMSDGRFYSENFLSLLTRRERARLHLTPLIGPKKARRFFRLDGKAVADFVGVPGFEVLSLVRCRKCKRQLSIYYLRDSKMYKFLALKDLPKPLPTVFAIGRPGDVRLCMTQARFSELIGRRGTRDISSSRVWVVPDNNFVRARNLR